MGMAIYRHEWQVQFCGKNNYSIQIMLSMIRFRHVKKENLKLLDWYESRIFDTIKKFSNEDWYK